ncbi:MAG: ribosomal RNA small subunit methyltransferase A [Bradymonadales bacterium]|nr:MAG: ribosomal RNA small subunit methyltransferase A [Bradymonadales bacterium]
MRAKWGQNFLVDSAWQARIVSYFTPEREFAEIGPGRAALTKHLKKKYSSFLLFEIDPQFKEIHTEDSKDYPYYQQDFLDWDFCVESKPVLDFSLIGNLPYESATAMILKIVKHSDQVKHFVFLVQREVAERLASKSGCRAYGSLSVLVQSYYEIELGPVVPPGAFRPAPKVDSQIVVGNRREPASSWDSDYAEFLKSCFLYKRKRLLFSLKKRFSEDSIRALYRSQSWSDNLRAEEIPLKEWPKIYRELKSV